MNFMRKNWREIAFLIIGQLTDVLLDLVGGIKMPIRSISIIGVKISWPIFFTLCAAIIVFIIYVVRFVVNAYKRSRPTEKLKRLVGEVEELSEILSSARFGSICEPEDGEQRQYYSCAKKTYEKIEKICHTKRPHPEMYGRFFSEILLSASAGDIDNVRIISELPYLQTPLLHEFRQGRNRNNDQKTGEG